MDKFSYQFISKSAEPMLHRILWDTKEDVLPGTVQGPEKRNVFLIECNVSGYGKVIINGNEFQVKPRCCYIMRPGDIVTMIADDVDPRQALWCMFGGARVLDILDNVGINADNPFVNEEDFDEVKAILEKLYAIRLKTDTGSELLKTAYIYEFLGVISRGTSAIERNIVAERAISIMETEYSRNMSVSDIASELGFDRSYFSTIFKECTGTAPYEYLTLLRLRKACDLLCSTDLSINEVAERVGIDPHNFSRIFKRELGVLPVKYKNSLNKEEVQNENQGT